MNYLITGITGTLGKIVARTLLDRGDTVIGISRDEYKQQLMFKHPNLHMYIGDIKDPHSFKNVRQHVDYIFHFAALKHIDICGLNPWECVATNIYGTQNVLDYMATTCAGKLVLASTDKAFKPINQYGKCKAVAENLVAANEENAICRYGNVFGSRGSVVHKFLATLRYEQKVYVTDPNMTRFFMRQADAAEFVIRCMDEDLTGIQIPTMKSTDIETLAIACAKYLGVGHHKMWISGNRGAEKIHEEMSDDHNSYTSERFTIDELVAMIAEVDQ